MIAIRALLAIVPMSGAALGVAVLGAMGSVGACRYREEMLVVCILTRSVRMHADLQLVEAGRRARRRSEFMRTNSLSRCAHFLRVDHIAPPGYTAAR